MSNSILLVGAGRMGVAYARVLVALERKPIAVCRSSATAEAYADRTGLSAVAGGLRAYLAGVDAIPDEAIVAVDVDQLANVTEALIEAGVRRILVEKPGGLNYVEIARVARAAERAAVKVLVGYNRRFYASTRRALEVIAEDGGVSSVVFDFTEVARIVPQLKQAAAVKAAWGLANSSHVMDLAFFMAGDPVKLECQVGGSLPWHPSAAVFCGFGRTKTGALFSYHADWRAPARWGVDLRTPLRRLIMCPLETLKIQTWEGFDQREEPLDVEIDRTYKPGLLRQVDAFLNANDTLLVDISQQAERVLRIFDVIMTGKGGGQACSGESISRMS
jgi:predicted dehydrogenase